MSGNLCADLDDGRWLTLQHPESAGFALPDVSDVVVLLAGVEVLPGAVGASGPPRDP